ncbi:MAG TPA: helix-turn-helix domain-containing protein [Acidobacteriaceae bacterium]
MPQVMRHARAEKDPASPVREVMDIRQAAAYLGISADSLYRYAAENTIPAFRLGNRWRFKKSRLDAWMDAQSDAGAERQAGGSGADRPSKLLKRQKKPVRAVR